MNQVDLFWDKYWAGYLGYLFLLVVPDHVLELIMVWVLDHVLKFFFFFFFGTGPGTPPKLAHIWAM